MTRLVVAGCDQGADRLPHLYRFCTAPRFVIHRMIMIVGLEKTNIGTRLQNGPPRRLAALHHASVTMPQAIDLFTPDDSAHATVRHINPSASLHPSRIEAINFAVAHDDGQSDHDLNNADLILIGVSGSGKTSMSLYLAMHHGLKAANYPLVPEDFERLALPPVLRAQKHKLLGLSLPPARLSEIRKERRPHSGYAALDNCQYEVREAEAMMRRAGIRWLATTTKSIEEISTTILQEMQPQRLRYQGEFVLNVSD